MIHIENADKMLEQAVKREQKSISKGDKRKAISVFAQNTKMLKSLIKRGIWPALNKDRSTFHNAWLIAQHSDHDVYFQLQYLGLLLPEIKDNKELLLDGAFLIDRILANLGKEQIFGTQINARLKPPDVFSPKHLELLRKKIGLEPMESYLNTMKEFSKKQNPLTK
jgi:hypothetical protein